MQALSVHAGPRALAALREHGLQPQHVRMIPAAAGGPKGLVLNPLDQYLFSDWLAGATPPVHLLGASIGAWRMAAACLKDPAAALAQMAHDYIHQVYEHAPARRPTSRHVSDVFGANLRARFGGRSGELLDNPRFRLHVFTSRGRHLLRRHGRALSSISTPLGYAGSYAANALSRRWMGAWWERVVFSDPRDPLPIQLHDYRTHHAPLRADNLPLSLLASCSIPSWLDPVHDIPGAPRGAYWDGGITDYHLHLNYASMADGPHEPGALDAAPALVLYPHFQPTVIPGWLDKFLKHRHRATAKLSNVVVLSPSPQWVDTLPDSKLPDRADFERYGDDAKGRIAAWSRAVRESERLRDEFAAWVSGALTLEVRPLV
ncbi:MAG: phospholipase [Burkholderiales bacterium]|nr:phospholipase [Burkholderiales bacterium]MDE2626273.1 phospholipase [Burkholderiales bacterium]